MKPIKFVILALGILCAIGVFLPLVDLGPIEISFWKLRAEKPAATYIALLSSLGMAGIAGLAVSKQKFSRGMAAGTAVLGLVIAVITIIQFETEMPFGKVAGLGAKILLFGGGIALVASLVGVVKPDRGNA